MIYLGIDPGNSGAIAARETDFLTGKPISWGICKLEETEADVACFLRHTCEETDCDGCTVFPEHSFALLEKVSSMPGQGVSSTFKFGQSYGFLRGLLVAHRIPFETVTPAKWQREFSLPTLKQCGDNNTVKKNAHKARAQELFPELKITHATADALLIAEYCRRTRTKSPA